jgi:hypothetical protein
MGKIRANLAEVLWNVINYKEWLNFESYIVTHCPNNKTSAKQCHLEVLKFQISVEFDIFTSTWKIMDSQKQ